MTRQRTITWEDPAQHAGEAFTHGGMHYWQRVLRGEVPKPPIMELLDFDLVSAEEGRVVFAGEPAEFHYNPIGVVHGGFAATLLDSAMGCAVHTTLPVGVGYTTADLQVRYTRALRMGTGPVRCEGTVVHRGRRIITAEGRVTDDGGKVYAHGSTGCLLLPLDSASGS